MPKNVCLYSSYIKLKYILYGLCFPNYLDLYYIVYILVINKYVQLLYTSIYLELPFFKTCLCTRHFDSRKSHESTVSSDCKLHIAHFKLKLEKFWKKLRYITMRMWLMFNKIHAVNSTTLSQIKHLELELDNACHVRNPGFKFHLCHVILQKGMCTLIAV